jgi:adenosine kinase
MTQIKYDQVMVFGSIARDESFNFPSVFHKHLNSENKSINISFAVDSMDSWLGGSGTNIAYNLRLLYQGKVYILGAVGQDGKDIYEFFQNKNIDTSLLLQDRNLFTSTGKCLSDSQQNQIWTFYYGASQKAKEISLPQNLQKTLFVLSPNHPKAFLNIQKQLIKYKYDYLFDPGMALTWITDEDLLEGVKAAKWLVANEYETESILKRLGGNMQNLLQYNTDVIITKGDKGVVYYTKDKMIEVPAVKKVKFVDATAAGDSWRAGFLYGFLENCEIKKSLAFGNTLASFTIENKGGVSHSINKEKFQKRLNSLIRE